MKNELFICQFLKMSAKKYATTDLPVKYNPQSLSQQSSLSQLSRMRQVDTPTLENHDSALTTMRRIGGDENNRNTNIANMGTTEDVLKSCSLFVADNSLSKAQSIMHGIKQNTRENRKRLSENTDPSTLDQIEILSSHRDPLQPPTLTFLYSSVKSALKDNLNTLDFSRKHNQESRKQQLRYYVHTHESEASIIQDNDAQTVTLNSGSNYERRQSHTTEKGVGSTPFDYTHGEIKVDLGASMKSSKSLRPLEIEENNGMQKSLSKRQLLIQDAGQARDRVYHTFSNENQTTLNTSLKVQQELLQSMRKSSSKQLQQSIDPSTPMFSCQKPISNALYQSMHMPSTSTHDDKNEMMHDNPQIISRTLGVMKLNTSSSQQSLDQQLREEVFNLTIKRPQVIEQDDDEDQTQIEVSTQAIVIKPKQAQATKKKAPQSAGLGGQLSKTQKLYLGGIHSHQQSRFTAASRILSPLSSQKSSFIGQITSSSTTPKVSSQQKPLIKKRPKSTGNTNNTSINQKLVSNKAFTTVQSRTSIAPSFSKQSSKFTTLQPPPSHKPLEKNQVKPTLKKLPSKSLSRQPANLTAQQSSSSFIKINPKSSSSLTVSNSLVKIGQTRTFSPTMFNTTTTVIRNNNMRPQSSNSVSTVRKTSNSVVSKSKKKKSASKSPYNANLPSQKTTATNITLRNQNSKSSLVSFSTKYHQTLQSHKPTFSPPPIPSYMAQKCNIIRKGLQQRGQSLSDKNEVVAQMVQEKKGLTVQIQQMKKEIIQNQKQVKALNDNSKQIGDDVVRLGELVLQKADRNQQLQKEIALARREVRQLQQDCDDMKQAKNSLILKIESEYQLVDVVQRLIVNLKKQTNEVRREKERLQIAVRGEQRKAIDVISKRRTLITEESEKIYMDFRDTMGNNNATGGGLGSCSLGQGHSSRSHLHSLHTPKGFK